MNQANKLKDTLNLPQTEFPMRANAVENEPQRITHWEDSRVYEKTLQKNKDSKAFVLHDGPPFTNGDVHVGTALNKILKDTIIRFKNAQDFPLLMFLVGTVMVFPLNSKSPKSFVRKSKSMTTSVFDSLVLIFPKVILRLNVASSSVWVYWLIGKKNIVQ